MRWKWPRPDPVQRHRFRHKGRCHPRPTMARGGDLKVSLSAGRSANFDALRTLGRRCRPPLQRLHRPMTVRSRLSVDGARAHRPGTQYGAKIVRLFGVGQNVRRDRPALRAARPKLGDRAKVASVIECSCLKVQGPRAEGLSVEAAVADLAGPRGIDAASRQVSEGALWRAFLDL
jgi:hypothetical protein